ncbi:GAK system CofD-like protein [Aliiglaciecola lipolytica]|uniref:GAK system CofD-like protein n=1 Tax=Aliiglaciecola lipolytica E3 TaxID=1127673 RepID=K6Y6K6_9ALTE|nr:GAK system CofD-like protein [Aliiglaciecola lipolytica]GAC13837.1 conserved hypothetical protein [Aliiglaciecola lipolytica E3]
MTAPLITRGVAIPDRMRISRCAKIPELGPRMLFFSGGSALNGAARKLKNYTHNSIHLVSPYDSGGSSAVIREFFDMPAVGDLRSRMMALADESVLGHPEIIRLFNYRFSKTASNSELKRRIESMVAGEDSLTQDIINPMRSLICNHLGYFFKKMPAAFNLRGASIGNLIIVGGYINHHRELDPIIYLFSELVKVRGIVRSITDDNFHLAAELADGSQIIGQHRLTGKENPPISSPIVKLRLSSELTRFRGVTSSLKSHNRRLISTAELICYSPGSFYSSLIANLLPHGISESIADNPCPKVYIPNRGTDPEQVGMTLKDQVNTLISRLQVQFHKPIEVNRLLNFIVYDSRGIPDKDKLDHISFAKMGIQVIDTPLINQNKPDVYDDDKLVKALISMT